MGPRNSVTNCKILFIIALLKTTRYVMHFELRKWQIKHGLSIAMVREILGMEAVILMRRIEDNVKNVNVSPTLKSSLRTEGRPNVGRRIRRNVE